MLIEKKIASKSKEKKFWVKFLVGKKNLIYQKKPYLPHRRRRSAAPPPAARPPPHNPGRRIRAVAGQRGRSRRGRRRESARRPREADPRRAAAGEGSGGPGRRIRGARRREKEAAAQGGGEARPPRERGSAPCRATRPPCLSAATEPAPSRRGPCARCHGAEGGGRRKNEKVKGKRIRKGER